MNAINNVLFLIFPAFMLCYTQEDANAEGMLINIILNVRIPYLSNVNYIM